MSRANTRIFFFFSPVFFLLSLLFFGSFLIRLFVVCLFSQNEKITKEQKKQQETNIRWYSLVQQWTWDVFKRINFLCLFSLGRNVSIDAERHLDSINAHFYLFSAPSLSRRPIRKHSVDFFGRLQSPVGSVTSTFTWPQAIWQKKHEKLTLYLHLDGDFQAKLPFGKH